MSPNHRTSFVFMAFAAVSALAVGCGTGWIVAVMDESRNPLTSLRAGAAAFCLIFFGSAGWAAVLKSSDTSAQGGQPSPSAANQAPPNNQSGTPVA
ncbi:hypothetical protein OIE99_11465 [Streptomyces cellulosae]|nr:hypothetical protein OIE99_11465 [Streptomyces cellulosae]